ncbi:MAG: hypothetical protein ACLP6E_12405 [Acidimicrobiales bacterium]
MASNKSSAVHGLEPAIRELDLAVGDIRSSVVSWRSGYVEVGPRRSTDELGAVITHLSAASGTLGQLVARTNAGDDGCRFAAVNDSDRLVSSALIMLLDALGTYDSAANLS